MVGAPPQTRIMHFQRMKSCAGQPGVLTLFFGALTGEREVRTMFFRPEAIPFFDGDEGWFEAEPVKGGWRFVRHLDERDVPPAT